MEFDTTQMTDKLTKTFSKDIKVLGFSLLLSILFCVYQFYLQHYAVALLFSFFCFVNVILLLVVYSLYNKTKRVFEQSAKMVDEMLDQMEKEGKI